MTYELHWAAALIGRPYCRGACGPDEFDCWGLVRYIFEQIHGIAMPVIAVGPAEADTPDNVAAIKRAAEISGWRPSDDRGPAEHDIVLMSGVDGRHVGVMVAANGTLLLLHCVEPQGVCAQPLAEMQRAGFTGATFWRRSGAGA